MQATRGIGSKVRVSSRADKHLPIRSSSNGRRPDPESRPPRHAEQRFRDGKILPPMLANNGSLPTSIAICPTKPIFQRDSKLIARQLIDAHGRICLNESIAPAREELEARGPCGAGNYGKAVEGRKRGGLRLVSVLELANISKHFGAIQAVND
ncbi:MAG: hypothetical protein E5X94_06365, partial [Mesorhizobium sp.]